MNTTVQWSSSQEIKKLAEICLRDNQIDKTLYTKYDVKRGLRDINGKGVLAGLTQISQIQSTQKVNGQDVPCDGRLFYRGIDIRDLTEGFIREGRLGYEESAYLLLFGKLPNAAELENFKKLIVACRMLPTNFVRDVVMKAPRADMMNTLSRSVLTLANYDKYADDISIPNVIRQCIKLIGIFPMLAVYGFHSYNHYQRDKSLYIHRPKPELSMAENILRMLRPDKRYSELEARVLDLALVLHMEHGGGNNSSFTMHVVTSSGTDTYSSVAAALASLKGPKHGGANIKVVEMIADLKSHVQDLTDRDAVENYLEKLVDREAFDRTGLIYGMGHAVYSLSDPRALIFRDSVASLAKEKGLDKDLALYTMIEELAPQVIARKRRIYKGVSANVDFYSGFVYGMLGLPKELFTPMFAVARIVGWSAHRLEELINMDKIIRPSYLSVSDEAVYTPLAERI